MGRVLTVSQAQPSELVLAEAAATLAFGGVTIVPTDSVYGIACAALPDNPGHERIFDIKLRERSQKLPWLVADFDDLSRYSEVVSGNTLALATFFWPGALTLVVRASSEVPVEYRSADGTIALRMPDSNLVRELARRVGVPLATTSANTHGKEAATTGEAVERRIVDAVDLVLDAGPAPLAVASTIVDVTGVEQRILREGAISAARLAEVLSA